VSLEVVGRKHFPVTNVKFTVCNRHECNEILQ
jgi:hypothetical protein